MQEQQISLQQKQKLKDQAKSLLLKGCYKMAMNKYIRLIGQKSQGFSQRQWAVIHLNLGIAYQFQQRFQQAIEQVNRSIQIDAHYDKAYYRKVQILGEMGQQQKAFSLNLPEFARNKEIEELQMSFRESYKNSMGIETLIRKVQHQNQMFLANQVLDQSHINFIEEIHHGLYDKISAEFDVQQECSLSMIKNILSQAQDNKSYHKIVLLSQKLSQYFLLLHNLTEENPNKSKYLASYMKFVQKMAYNLNFKGISILMCFWKTFLDQIIVRWDKSSKEEKKLLCLCPSILYGTQSFTKSLKILLQRFMKSQDKQSQKDLQKFLHVNSIFVPYRLILIKIHAQDIITKQLISIEVLDSFIDVIGQEIQNRVEKAYDIDIQNMLKIQTSLIRLLLEAYPKFSKDFLSNLQIQTLGDLLKFSHFISTKAQQTFEKSKNQTRKIITGQKQIEKFRQLVQCSLIKDSLVYMLILQRMVGFFPKQQIKQLASLLKSEIQKINSQNPQKNKRSSLKKIVYTNMIFKIDIKQSVKHKDQAVSIHQTFKRVLKNNKGNRRSLNMLELYEVENILLSCLNNSQHILCLLKSDFNELKTFLDITLHNTILNSKQDVIIEQKKQLKNDRQSIPHVQLLQLVSNLLFLLIVDSQKQMQKMMAQKMGVTEQQMQKARKLQGQLSNQSQRKKLKQLRVQFSKFLSKQGQSIFIQICNYFNSIKSYNIQQLQECSLKLAKVFRDLAQIQPSRFYHNPVLQFMVEPNLLSKSKQSKDKRNNEYNFNFSQNYLPQLSKFLSTILKKSNPQVLPYPLIQNMVRILEWSVNNGEHELIIFESYLSLISLSSLNGVKICLQKISHGLLEENQYIVHGTLQLMNNILLMNDCNGQNLVDSYYEFFNTDISNKPSKAIANLKNTIIIVQKYIKHYRDIIKSDNPLLKKQPITDYSHPYKIFSTLVSLCLVLKLNKVDELQTWQNAQDMLKRMYRKNEGSKNKEVALCMFKLVLHHYNSNHSVQEANMRKNKKWFQEEIFMDLIRVLEITDKQKAAKLKQVIR